MNEYRLTNPRISFSYNEASGFNGPIPMKDLCEKPLLGRYLGPVPHVNDCTALDTGQAATLLCDALNSWTNENN